MTKHLARDMTRLERGILLLGSMVEEAINKAIVALINRRAELAREVIDGDTQIDMKEVELEEECLKVMALHQPVATDLRFIIAAIKVNYALERMGDLASNIAKAAVDLAGTAPLETPFDMFALVDKVRAMVRNSLDSLVHQDVQLARQVCADDTEVDVMRRQYMAELTSMMQRDSSTIERGVVLLLALRHLERIADQTTNIAEDVVFMVEGEIIRHGNYQPHNGNHAG